MNTIDISVTIGVVSAVTSVVSLFFAWKAVKTAERNNFASIYAELHKIYQEPQTFNAIKTVWELYSQYDGSAQGEMIPYQQALELVKKTDRNSVEWQSIHNLSLFWRHISVLTRRGYLDERVAFKAFTSPSVLGFLAPIEKAFLEYHYGETSEENLQLFCLYNRWRKYKEKN